jgi:hypothetical protein
MEIAAIFPEAKLALFRFGVLVLFGQLVHLTRSKIQAKNHGGTENTERKNE